MKEKLNTAKEWLKDNAIEVVAISGYIGVLAACIPLYKWMCKVLGRAIADGIKAGLNG